MLWRKAQDSGRLSQVPCYLCGFLALTSWRTFCPVCKRDATTGRLTDPPPSESTPLLLLTPASVASSVLSSVRSSLASSSAIQILRVTPQAPSVSGNHSLASTPYVQPSLRYYHRWPSLCVSQSSVDLKNASQRSLASHLNSPHSMGYPSLSSLKSKYISPHFRSPSYAFIGSSSHQQHPLHHSESAASFSPLLPLTPFRNAKLFNLI